MLCRIRTCVAANAAQDFDRSSKSITFELGGRSVLESNQLYPKVVQISNLLHYRPAHTP